MQCHATTSCAALPLISRALRKRRACAGRVWVTRPVGLARPGGALLCDPTEQAACTMHVRSRAWFGPVAVRLYLILFVRVIYPGYHGPSVTTQNSWV
jgi:hypothetical protein